MNLKTNQYKPPYMLPAPVLSDEMTTDQMWKEIREWERKCDENDARVNARLLKAIEAVRGTRFLEQLKLSIAYDGICIVGCYELVSAPSGKYQREPSGNLVPGYWVDQWCGITGDSGSGYMYYKLRKNKYLKIHYSF